MKIFPNETSLEFRLLFSLLFLLIMVGCTNEDDEIIEIEPKEIACRIIKLKVDGQLNTEYLYNNSSRLIREKHYENGEIANHLDYSYASDVPILTIDVFNANDEKEAYSELIHNNENFVDTRINWLVSENGDQYNGEEVYSYLSSHFHSICSIEEARYIEADGSLIERIEYLFTDENCSYVSSHYIGNAEEVSFTSTITYDDKPSKYESISPNYGRTLHNSTKEVYEFANGTIDSILIELEYNEFDYPIRAIITDENGDTRVEEYEYICE